MRFPAAANGGVRWTVLVKKYEERYSTRLNIASLGHSDPVTAATTLLFDVLRLVEHNQTCPVVAAEDAHVLTPRPGLMGSWPSLYQTLCTVVTSSGAVEPSPLPGGADDAGGAPRGLVRSLLLSKLKPLLMTHWHPEFDETNLSFFNEDGTVGRVKKMKHLVTAVLRWRDERVAQRRGRSPQASRRAAIDDALAYRLELVPSTAHNDMVLRCFPPTEAEAVAATEKAEAAVACPATSPDLLSIQTFCRDGESWWQQSQDSAAEEASERCAPVTEKLKDENMEHELAKLRAENQELRCMNEELVRREHSSDSVAQSAQFQTPCKQTGPPIIPEIGFDDPFEPPEQCWRQSACSTPLSTALGSTSFSNIDLFSGTASHASATPMSSFAYPDGHSEDMTPAGMQAGGLSEQFCALMPVWFDHRCVIPTGIVDRFRSQFESAACPGAASSMPVIPQGIVGRFRSQFESTAGPGATTPLFPPMHFRA
jgi:hypothetical protein